MDYWPFSGSYNHFWLLGVVLTMVLEEGIKIHFLTLLYGTNRNINGLVRYLEKRSSLTVHPRNVRLIDFAVNVDSVPEFRNKISYIHSPNYFPDKFRSMIQKLINMSPYEKFIPSDSPDSSINSDVQDVAKRTDLKHLYGLVLGTKKDNYKGWSD